MGNTVLETHLVQRIAARDGDALEQLYEQYERSVYSFIYRIVGDMAVAEDIVQELFFKIWNNEDSSEAAPFDSGEGIWIFTLARDLSINWSRRHGIRLQGAGQLLEGAAAAQLLAGEALTAKQWREVLAAESIDPSRGLKLRVLGMVLGGGSTQDEAAVASVEAPREEEARIEAMETEPLPSPQTEQVIKGQAEEASEPIAQSPGQITDNRRPRVVAVLAGAAAVMLLVSGALAQRMDNLDKRSVLLEKELQTARSSQEEARSELASALAPSAGAAISKAITLKPGKGLTARGQAYITVDAKGRHLIVQASRLPALKDGLGVYQVWLMKGEAAVNAGSFKPMNGSGAVAFTFPPDAYDGVVVTAEPDVDGDTPRGASVLNGSLLD